MLPSPPKRAERRRLAQGPQGRGKQISKACELFESLNRTDPANYWWKLVRSQYAGNAADAEVKAGEYKEAEKHYQQAIKLQERISEDDNRFVQPLRDLARSHKKLGEAFWEHAKKEKRTHRHRSSRQSALSLPQEQDKLGGLAGEAGRRRAAGQAR